MRTLTKCGMGLVCLAALSLVLAGCGNPANEKNPLDISTLDPFMQAMIHAKNGAVSKLEAVLAANEGLVNERNEDGMTLLHYAVIASQPDTVKLLIDRGADVNAVDDATYQTPLEAAEAERADEKVLKLLRDAGGT